MSVLCAALAAVALGCAAFALRARRFAVADLALTAWVLGCAAGHSGVAMALAPNAQRAARPDAEWWVDASATDSGNGSSSRPWRALADALARVRGRTWIHLAAGIYRGPIELGSEVRMIGAPGAVLAVDAAPAVLRTSAPLELESLDVRGGEIGVDASADLRLSGVRFSGQRQAAICQRGGGLEAHRLNVVGSGTDEVGIRIEPGSSARIADSVFRGGLRIGVEIAGAARLDLRASRFEGPSIAVRSRQAAVQVASSSASGGSEPAFAFVGGSAVMREVRVLGHEYGVLASAGCVLDVSGFTSFRARRAGIALVSSKGVLSEIVVLESGGYGGVQSVNGDLRLQDFRIDRARSYGILLHDGTAQVRDGVVSKVADPDSGGAGDGIHVRLGRVSVASVTIRQTDGAGVLAAQMAQVVLRDLQLDGNRWGGLVADTGAHVEASSILIRRSDAAAIAIPGGAVVKVDLLHSTHNARGVVWTDCPAGAEVLLSRVRSGNEEERASRCVGRWQAPHLFDPLCESHVEDGSAR